MKRLLTLLSATLLFAVLWSCEEVEDVAVFSLSSTEVSMSSAEGESTITVTAEEAWSATSSATWCAVSQQDSKLLLRVEKNYVAEPRTATVTVTSGVEELSVAVTQAAGSGKFEAFTVSSSQYPTLLGTEGDELSLPYTEGVIPLTVTVQDKHCSWSVELLGAADFITVPTLQGLTSDKSFDIVVSENATTKSRECKVKLWSEYQGLECVYVLTIKQSASDPLTVSQAKLNFESEEGSAEVTVTGGKKPWEATSSAEWCVAEKNEGTLTVKVTKNEAYEPRTATVTVVSGEEQVEIKVTQSASTAEPLEVSKSELSFEPEEGSVEVTVTGGKEPWEATSSAEWCVAEKNEGTLTVKVTKNEAYESRTATVTVVSGEEQVEINVTQSASAETPLTASKTEVAFAATESSSSIAISGGKEAWSAESSAEWCTVEKANNTLKIKVKTNYTTEPRTAVVTVSSGEEQVEVKVTQAASDGLFHAFTVSSTQYDELPEREGGEISLPFDEAEITIRVTRKDSNCKWSATVLEGAEFVTIPELVDVSGSRSFDIAVPENIAQTPREAKIQIRSEYQGMECVYILTIKQEAGSGVYDAFSIHSSKYPYITETEAKNADGSIIYTRDKAFIATCTACEIPIRVFPKKSHYKWSAEVVEGADFITIPRFVDCTDAQTFSVQLADNTTTSERVGKVKISSTYHGFEQTYELVVKQQKYMQHTPKADELKVMSFNVWVNRSGALSWNNRKSACYSTILYHRPALIGIQEAMCKWHWRDLVDVLKKSGYEGYGLSPYEKVDAYVSTKGGTSGVFYDTALFEKLNCGTFWISETPDVAGSKSWNSNDIRIGTWLILKHKSTGKMICYINTHLDHISSAARVEGMKLIMKKFEELGKDCDYWISTGDYNTSADNVAFDAIKGKMKNARTAAPATRTDNSRTYHAANATRASNPIDHVLCSESMEVVEYHTIIENFPDVPYTSDHYPVYAIMKLSSATTEAK